MAVSTMGARPEQGGAICLQMASAPAAFTHHQASWLLTPIGFWIGPLSGPDRQRATRPADARRGAIALISSHRGCRCPPFLSSLPASLSSLLSIAPNFPFLLDSTLLHCLDSCRSHSCLPLAVARCRTSLERAASAVVVRITAGGVPGRRRRTRTQSRYLRAAPHGRRWPPPCRRGDAGDCVLDVRCTSGAPHCRHYPSTRHLGGRADEVPSMPSMPRSHPDGSCRRVSRPAPAGIPVRCRVRVGRKRPHSDGPRRRHAAKCPPGV